MVSELLFISILYDRVKQLVLTFFAFGFGLLVKFVVSGKVLEVVWKMLPVVFMEPRVLVEYLGSDVFCTGEVRVDAKVGVF